MDLSLEELREQGRGRDIVPPRASFALWSAIPMGYTLPWLCICNLNGAVSVAPISWVFRSLLWPQRCWTNKSHAGPRSNSRREFPRVWIDSYHLGAMITLTGCRISADRFRPWKIRLIRVMNRCQYHEKSPSRREAGNYSIIFLQMGIALCHAAQQIDPMVCSSLRTKSVLIRRCHWWLQLRTKQLAGIKFFNLCPQWHKYCATKLDSRTKSKLNSFFDSVNFNTPGLAIESDADAVCSNLFPSFMVKCHCLVPYAYAHPDQSSREQDQPCSPSQSSPGLHRDIYF